MNKKDELELLSSPGDTIKETLEFKKMTAAQLSAEADMDYGLLHKIIRGKAKITKKTALKLEKGLGIDAQFWLNREKNYREKLNKLI